MGPCANLLYPWWRVQSCADVYCHCVLMTAMSCRIWLCDSTPPHLSILTVFLPLLLRCSGTLNLGQGQGLLWLLMVILNFPLGLSTQQLLFSAFWPDFSLWIIHTLCKKDFFFLSWEQCYGYKQNTFLFPGKHLYCTLNARPHQGPLSTLGLYRWPWIQFYFF